MRRLALSLALLLSCTAPGPAVVFDTAAASARVRVEIADTPELREKGLMGRTSLADDAGMLFQWPDDTANGFWMKDTLIPLSIAFVAADGRVLALLDMEPCRADPCPVYDPHVSYRMAVEANRGAFARWGVRVGDRARLVR
jgi:uncharacterized membrane protein (UPF0127 family)